MQLTLALEPVYYVAAHVHAATAAGIYRSILIFAMLLS